MTITYLGETVRKNDPDRFLLSMFCPPDKRDALWALYAFNHDIAKTREVVTETQLGLIRLQWWRDAVGAIFDKGDVPAGHPVLQELAQVIRAHNLPREMLESLIYAREFDLEDRPPAHMGGLLNYADFTATHLMKMSLIIMAEANAPETSVKSISTAYALTGLLRAVPFHLRQRRCYLPENRISNMQGLYEGKGLELLIPVVRDIVSEARSLLTEKKDVRFLRLHAALASIYLDQIEKAGYDLFSQRMASPPVFKEIRLWWRSL